MRDSLTTTSCHSSAAADAPGHKTDGLQPCGSLPAEALHPLANGIRRHI